MRSVYCYSSRIEKRHMILAPGPGMDPVLVVKTVYDLHSFRLRLSCSCGVGNKLPRCRNSKHLKIANVYPRPVRHESRWTVSPVDCVAQALPRPVQRAVPSAGPACSRASLSALPRSRIHSFMRSVWFAVVGLLDGLRSESRLMMKLCRRICAAVTRSRDSRFAKLSTISFRSETPLCPMVCAVTTWSIDFHFAKA